MFEITRQEAIEMLVAEEIEHTDLDDFIDMYIEAITVGTRGYNELRDDELARHVEFTFNKIEGVRII